MHAIDLTSHLPIRQLETFCGYEHFFKIVLVTQGNYLHDKLLDLGMYSNHLSLL